MIVFACPTCGSHQRAGDHLIGRTFRCQVCRGAMTVPAASTPLPPEPRRQPTAQALLQSGVPAAAEPKGDDALFFEHIRKTSAKFSKHQ
jgi:hypothetical protein